MRKRFWLRRAAAVVLLVLAASAGFSRLLRAGQVHRYLNARLAAAFGRPVEVSEFSFSLLNGLRLEANSVSVAEDGRFGYEYFLRAERLTASPRWRALLRGRFEFGRLSFTRPSLNLVRLADGHWNVESWLPAPELAAGAAPASAGASPAARLYRIEVDGGRINFKRGVDKDAFALVDVKGHIEQEAAGRWRIDLEARPTRSAVALQEPGKLRLRGRVAGTSARLQPAELLLTWEAVSLADGLRLVRGRDFGARGHLAAELTARIVAPGVRWSLAGTVRLAGVHRWDMPQRTGDPALNLSFEAQWRPGEARVEFRQCTLAAPGSNMQGAGSIEWAPALNPQFHFTSSGISLADLLAWHRAFQPRVAGDLVVEGHAGAEFSVVGWPPRLEQGVLASNGARMRSAALPEPIRLGSVTARVVRGRLVFDPIVIALPTGGAARAEAPPPLPRAGPLRQGNAIRLEGAIGPAEGFRHGLAGEWQFGVRLVGQTDSAEDLLAAAAALGHPLRDNWTAVGPVSLDLRWQGTARPFVAQPVGTIELHGLRVQVFYLNRPVTLSDGRIELRPDEQRVILAAAQAFGAHWKGWLKHSAPASSEASSPWEFELSADRLDAAEFDRWLGPRARPGSPEGVFPSGVVSGGSGELDASLARLHGRGRLGVDEVVVSPLRVHRLQARVEVEGRSITLEQAQGSFFEGKVRGAVRAQLSAQPSYSFSARFERANLASLAEATATLKGRFAGVASGTLQLTARGIGRENLLASLEGRGNFQARSAEMRGLDLRASYAGSGLVPGRTQFSFAEGVFSLAGKEVQVERLRLSNPADDFAVGGSVGFSRALDLRVQLLGRPRGTRAAASGGRTLRLTGTLDAPRVARPEPVNRPQ